MSFVNAAPAGLVVAMQSAVIKSICIEITSFSLGKFEVIVDCLLHLGPMLSFF
jgi:hypothetical protein